jgi:hypothetical protein
LGFKSLAESIIAFGSVTNKPKGAEKSSAVEHLVKTDR